MFCEIINSDYRQASFTKKADIVIIDPPHDQYFDDLFLHIDRCSKVDAVKIIIDSDKNIARYTSKHFERFSFFMVHDFILHIGNKHMPLHQFDLIAVFDYSSKKFNNLNDGFSNVIRSRSERMRFGSDNLKHKHQKPLYLYTKLIEHFSIENDIILDFFLGSGMIIQAASQLKRNVIGSEIDTHVFNKIHMPIFNNKQAPINLFDTF